MNRGFLLAGAYASFLAYPSETRTACAKVTFVQLCLPSRRTWIGLWHKNRLFLFCLFFLFFRS